MVFQSRFIIESAVSGSVCLFHSFYGRAVTGSLNCSIISEEEAVPSTPIEFVSRLTEQEITPGTLETAFSTRVWQAAQLIPVIVYCSIFVVPFYLHIPNTGYM